MTVPKAPAFSVGEYRRRIATVQQGLAERDLDAVVLFSPGNINYLTGMDSENLFDLQACLLTRDTDPVLVMFDFERGRFDNSAWLATPVAYGPFDDPIMSVVDELRRLGLDRARLGIEQRQAGLPPRLFLKLQAALPWATVEDAFGPVERARLVKSTDEIALMRQAAAFTDEGVQAGSDPVCWGPVVAAGYRAGLAHSSFNGHVIARGETVFLELTGQHRRYVAPVMRTAVVGTPTAEHRRLAQASADAVAAILETARAGVPARTVAEAGLRFIRPVERNVVFHYYFGYPVGIGYPPSWIEALGFFIRADNPAPVEAGMVFHLPMSLRVAGRLGICLSHTMLVTPDGGVPLTGTSAELAEVPA